jgi:hypothetical protein
LRGIVPTLRDSYRFLYDAPMKTTLDLNDALLADAKALAARQRTSLTRLIEEGLQLRLRAARGAARSGRTAAPALPVYRGKGGVLPGVDVLSNKSMLDVADAGDERS